MNCMDNAPYDFCLNHTDNDLIKLLSFKHRTFNTTDLLYFVSFFNMHYKKYDSLEEAFIKGLHKNDSTVENGLNEFYTYFFSMPDVPLRTLKHIASPQKNSTCKRINMYLRWMVRKDKMGVDFGIWKKIDASQLICPLDVHVANVAYRFGLLPNTNSNWQNAVALTEHLKTLNNKDPSLYDYALFGLGAEERFKSF